MAKSVTTIPATLSRFTAAPINSTQKRRVAAYARVSTDQEEQLTSYEAHVDYYTNYIQGRDDWEFAGIYTDEGMYHRYQHKKARRLQKHGGGCAGREDRSDHH